MTILPFTPQSCSPFLFPLLASAPTPFFNPSFLLSLKNIPAAHALTTFLLNDSSLEAVCFAIAQFAYRLALLKDAPNRVNKKIMMSGPVFMKSLDCSKRNQFARAGL